VTNVKYGSGIGKKTIFEIKWYKNHTY
jgi:hypothetical protein